MVTRGRGGERTLEKGKKTEGGIGSADYAEHTELLAEKKQKPLPITGREERERWGDERRKVVKVGERENLKDGEETIWPAVWASVLIETIRKEEKGGGINKCEDVKQTYWSEWQFYL